MKSARDHAVDRPAAISVTIVGAGRAGSFATLALAMAGIRTLRIYDPDSLDPERNLGIQLYRAADVRRRRPKVEALARLMDDLHPQVSVTGICAAYPDGAVGPSGPIVLLCPDTMEARRRACAVLVRDRSVAALVDLRLGGTVVRCHTARGRANLRAHGETLYRDDESWGDPCGDSPAPHAALAAASLAASAVIACAHGRRFPAQLMLDVGHAPVLLTPDGRAVADRGR